MRPRGSTRTRFGTFIVVLSACVVVSGAAYFGLASCGGYGWHRGFFLAASVVLCSSALAMPGTPLASLKTKAAFAIGMPAIFVLLESAIAPFYPSAPESLLQYGKQFIEALEFGPCN